MNNFSFIFVVDIFFLSIFDQNEWVQVLLLLQFWLHVCELPDFHDVVVVIAFEFDCFYYCRIVVVGGGGDVIVFLSSKCLGLVLILSGV